MRKISPVLATFKETLTSITDKSYGQAIVAKPTKTVLWYWTRYVLLFTLVPLILIILFLTYITPQPPKLIRSSLGQIKVGVKSEKFYLSPPKEFTVGTQEFLLAYDPQGSASRLDDALSGIMLTSDKVYFKNPEGIQEQDFTGFPDFSLSVKDVADWIATHQSRFWLFLVSGVIVFTALAVSFYWLYHVSLLLLWAIGFWLVASLFKHRFELTQVFRITVYAAVPSLILSAILFIAPNQILSLLNFGLFLYFALSWLRNLTPKIN